MRKALILKVAFEQFAQKGYNTSLSEIAKEVGIKKQSLYNYFDSKDDLLYEAIKTELLYFYSTKTEEFNGYEEFEPEEILRKMYYSICNYFTDINRRRFWRWILLIESEELFSKCRDVIKANEGEFYGRVKKNIEKAVKCTNQTEDEVNASVQTFVVMIHGIVDGMLLYDGLFDPQILIENTWKNYWKSIQ